MTPTRSNWSRQQIRNARAAELPPLLQRKRPANPVPCFCLASGLFEWPYAYVREAASSFPAANRRVSSSALMATA